MPSSARWLPNAQWLLVQLVNKNTASQQFDQDDVLQVRIAAAGFSGIRSLPSRWVPCCKSIESHGANRRPQRGMPTARRGWLLSRVSAQLRVYAGFAGISMFNATTLTSVRAAPAVSCGANPVPYCAHHCSGCNFRPPFPLAAGSAMGRGSLRRSVH